jgi:hypothetical protein
MRFVLLILINLILFVSCNSTGSNNPYSGKLLPTDGMQSITSDDSAGYISWGYYNFEIATDGSYAEVLPDRSANMRWGYHLNVVKLLEVEPCTDCVSISNIYVNPEGNVSVDVSIKHPFTDRRYTGFDVRGIIMFPASWYYPDNELRAKAGLAPWNGEWHARIASSALGDAELVNGDGLTAIWNPVGTEVAFAGSWYMYDIKKYLDPKLPIFNYYPGKFASGDNLSTLSPFINFYSTETRHMFEAGKTVTRTYIIKPPATGLIKASYAVYAHWFPPDNVPVIDPATDFPPNANSPMPYEFWVTQDALLDPDAPDLEPDKHVHWHIKNWSIDPSYWYCGTGDFIDTGGTGQNLIPHPDGEPDDYMVTANYIGDYWKIPDAYPGIWPMWCVISVSSPLDPYQPPFLEVGVDVYIANFEYAPLDGKW